MYAKYKLFHSHIDLSHNHWRKLVKPGDTVVDATCGNGHDTLVLAELALTPDCGSLFALDLQPEAIDSCREMLANKLSKPVYNRIQFIRGCHTKFPKELLPGSVQLIAYNLGYLPGGDKSLTTTGETTLKSIQEAMMLVRDGGLISVTCYPGHPAGHEEENEVLEFSRTLDPKIWSCCHHRWTNRNNPPSLLLIQKRMARANP